MFDPFFGLSAVFAPIALVALMLEARRNRSQVPSVGICLLALFASYGLYVWLLMLSVALHGKRFDDQDFRVLQGASAVLAALIVGIPFVVSARNRRRRASADA